jgi:hypothetical protein
MVDSVVARSKGGGDIDESLVSWRGGNVWWQGRVSREWDWAAVPPWYPKCLGCLVSLYGRKAGRADHEQGADDEQSSKNGIQETGIPAWAWIEGEAPMPSYP